MNLSPRRREYEARHVGPATRGLLERDSAGRLVRGRPSEPGGAPGLVRLVPDSEMAMRASEVSPRQLPDPVYRDAAGNVVEKAPARVALPRKGVPLRLDGATVTVSSLREHVTRLLGPVGR